MVTVENL